MSTKTEAEEWAADAKEIAYAAASKQLALELAVEALRTIGLELDRWGHDRDCAALKLRRAAVLHEPPGSCDCNIEDAIALAERWSATLATKEAQKPVEATP